MPRKQTPAPLPPPKLTVLRDDAAAKINAQIVKGRALREIAIRSEDELSNARAEKKRWLQYNVELLTRLFDNPSIAQEYNPPRAYISGGDEYFEEKVQDFRKDVGFYITNLESILDRLELIPEPMINIIPADLSEPRETSHSSAHIQANTQSVGTVKDPRVVFVIHGRNEKARGSLFTFLRSIGLAPREWSELVRDTGKGSPYIGDVLDIAFSNAQAVVVLMTPDDIAQLSEPFRSPHDPPYESQPTGQARPNVLFEAGMAMGRNPDRTIIVELGTLRPFSDIAGRHTVRLSNATQSRQELAQRLETAGCPVNLRGRDWHTDGNFDPHKEPINPLTVNIESLGDDEAALIRSIRNKEADRKLFDELKRDLPSSGSIRVIRDHVMGAFSFEMKSLDDLYNFLENWDDVEHEFLDSELEEKRRRLYALIDEYTNLIELNTFPTKDGVSQYVPTEWMHEQNDKYVRVVNQLHGKAKEVVTAHQDLMRTARRKLEN